MCVDSGFCALAALTHATPRSYGSDTQYGSANMDDPNQAGAPPPYTGVWPEGTLARHGGFRIRATECVTLTPPPGAL